MSKFLWTQHTNFGPSPRAGSAIAYDANLSRVVLFGGVTMGDHSLPLDLHGDTWEWDGSFWTQVDDIGPFPRSSAAMVYDSTRKVCVLFGGMGAAGIGGVTIKPGDTWQWDGADWTQLSESGPPERTDHAMAFDNDRSRTLLFGGFAGTHFGDTWEFDGENWTQVHDAGPSPRLDHSMAYDDVGRRVILFGGNGDVLNLGDTWAWDGQEWVQIAEFGPAGRSGAAMASAGGSLILHGGARTGTDPQVLADTWEFDGKLWTQRQDIGPGPLQGASMAFDSGRSRMVLFGGNSASSFDDPQTLNGSTWESPITIAASPAPVAVASIIVPANVRAQQPAPITIVLTGPAPEGGAVVNFTGPIFAPNGADLGSVTITAGLTSMQLQVAFAGPPGAIVTITAQIGGTPAITISVPLQFL